MKKQLQFLIITSVLLLTAMMAAAQTRITFKRGATSAVATGYLRGYRDKKVFVIKVGRGQTLRTEQSKSDSSTHYITVAVKSPTGEDVGDSDASCNNHKEITPTVAGNYILEITECQKADRWRGSFRLSVRVK